MIPSEQVILSWFDVATESLPHKWRGKRKTMALDLLAKAVKAKAVKAVKAVDENESVKWDADGNITCCPSQRCHRMECYRQQIADDKEIVFVDINENRQYRAEMAFCSVLNLLDE